MRVHCRIGRVTIVGRLKVEAKQGLGEMSQPRVVWLV